MNNYDNDILGVGNICHPANQEETEVFQSEDIQECLQYARDNGDFEPLEFAVKIAKRNFDANPASIPIKIKQIGLSDKFAIKDMDYFPDWTTAFSTDDQTLESFLPLR